MEQTIKRIEDLFKMLTSDGYSILLTTKSIIDHLQTEEITIDELADTEFMLERIETWNDNKFPLDKSQIQMIVQNYEIQPTMAKS